MMKTMSCCYISFLPLIHRAMLLSGMVGLTLLPIQQAMAYKATMEYYHFDSQGSLLEVYDGATNKRLLSQAWSPWGERQVVHVAASGDRGAVGNLLVHGLPVRMGYTGHKELLATGLTFAGDTRLYDARLKRFLNSDDRTTGGVRGQNRYSYAYNNPMKYIDPNGRSPRENSRNRGYVLGALNTLLSGWSVSRNRYDMIDYAGPYAGFTATLALQITSAAVHTYNFDSSRERVASQPVGPTRSETVSRLRSLSDQYYEQYRREFDTGTMGPLTTIYQNEMNTHFNSFLEKGNSVVPQIMEALFYGGVNVLQDANNAFRQYRQHLVDTAPFEDAADDVMASPAQMLTNHYSRRLDPRPEHADELYKAWCAYKNHYAMFRGIEKAVWKVFPKRAATFKSTIPSNLGDVVDTELLCFERAGNAYVIPR